MKTKHWMVVASLALALGLVAFGKRPVNQALAGADGTLEVAAFSARLEGKDRPQLVDVRTPEEYAEGHLKGAKLMTLDSLDKRLGELDKGKPVLIYCRSGRRSAAALKMVKDAGFKDAVHLDGGILAWQGAGKPIEK